LDRWRTLNESNRNLKSQQSILQTKYENDRKELIETTSKLDNETLEFNNEIPKLQKDLV